MQFSGFLRTAMDRRQRRKRPRFMYPKAMMVEAFRVKPTSTMEMNSMRTASNAEFLVGDLAAA